MFTAIPQHLDYSTCRSVNCWHSVDAHFHNAAACVLRSLFSVIAAGILSVQNSE